MKYTIVSTGKEKGSCRFILGESVVVTELTEGSFGKSSVNTHSATLDDKSELFCRIEGVYIIINYGHDDIYAVLYPSSKVTDAQRMLLKLSGKWPNLPYLPELV